MTRRCTFALKLPFFNAWLRIICKYYRSWLSWTFSFRSFSEQLTPARSNHAVTEECRPRLEEVILKWSKRSCRESLDPRRRFSWETSVTGDVSLPDDVSKRKHVKIEVARGLIPEGLLGWHVQSSMNTQFDAKTRPFIALKCLYLCFVCLYSWKWVKFSLKTWFHIVLCPDRWYDI